MRDGFGDETKGTVGGVGEVEGEEVFIEADVSRAELGENAALRATEVIVEAGDGVARTGTVERGKAREAGRLRPLRDPALAEELGACGDRRGFADREGGGDGGDAGREGVEVPWAASLARASTASLPAISTWAGTQCIRTRRVERARSRRRRRVWKAARRYWPGRALGVPMAAIASWQSMKMSTSVSLGVFPTMSSARMAPATSDSKTVCSAVVLRCSVRCTPSSPPFIATAAAPTPPSNPDQSVNTHVPPRCTIPSISFFAWSFEGAMRVVSVPSGAREVSCWGSMSSKSWWKTGKAVRRWC